jgi:SulP family sulfate permease
MRCIPGGACNSVIAGLLFPLSAEAASRLEARQALLSLLFYGIIRDYGNEGLVAATLIAGFLMILMGFLRSGAFSKFFSYPWLWMY